MNSEELHQAVLDVEQVYGSVMKAPNYAMRPIWRITKRKRRTVGVSQSAYNAIRSYVQSLGTDHPQREHMVAKTLNHDPSWVRYRVQAYREERLIVKN